MYAIYRTFMENGELIDSETLSNDRYGDERVAEQTLAHRMHELRERHPGAEVEQLSEGMFTVTWPAGEEGVQSVTVYTIEQVDALGHRI